MQDLNDLYYFVQALTHGGFAPAGRALGVPKSKISRRVGLLEERLGVRLVQRSTRHFAVTEIGQTYYEHCKAMLVEAEAAQEAIDSARAEPRGTIRLSCPIALLHAQVGEMLANFMAAHPQVSVVLEATNRAVDVLGEGVDVAIRVRPPPLQDSDLVLRVLANRRQCLVASLELIRAYGPIKAPADLASLPSLGLGSTKGDYTWNLYGPNAQEVMMVHSPRLITSDMVALRVAAIAGVGVVQLPHQTVREQIDRGELVHVLPRWAPKVEIIHAVYPSRRGQLPSVRTLLDHLAKAFEEAAEE